MSKANSGDKFNVVGYRGKESIEHFGTAEEAFAWAVKQTAKLKHLHLVSHAEGNVVSPKVVSHG